MYMQVTEVGVAFGVSVSSTARSIVRSHLSSFRTDSGSFAWLLVVGTASTQYQKKNNSLHFFYPTLVIESLCLERHTVSRDLRRASIKKNLSNDNIVLFAIAREVDVCRIE